MSLKTETTGWLFGIGAFVAWGFAPIYFKAVGSVSAEEILAHRIAWCVPVTYFLMLALRKRIEIVQVLKNKKLMIGLFVSTALISSNWYIFTWAVTNEQILATSLGYFINPIMSILLGVIFLSEKLSRLQWAAVGCATLGVVNQIVNFGEIPWIALSLATTFGLYGFIRKQLAVDSLNGLLVETMIAFPIAAGYAVWMLVNGQAMFLNDSLNIDLLLVFGGFVTAVPLIWFAAAAKKIPLNSIGFLQFIAPSMSFVLATQLYNEPLGTAQFVSFAFIWLGLVLYLIKPLQLVLGKRSKAARQI